MTFFMTYGFTYCAYIDAFVRVYYDGFFRFENANTPFKQNSTHRGIPNKAHPSHFSGNIVGYHGA